MSDEDTIEEFVRSQRMKESVLAMTGRLSKTRSDGPKFVAPQLGTASRSRKVEARTFNQALSGNDERGSSGKSEVIRQLQENTRRNQGYTEPVANSTRTIRTSIGGLGVTQGSDDRIETVVNLLKEKYEQNLLVVDKLFHEKKQMANKIKMLEEKLNTVSQNGSRINSQDEGDDYYGDVPQRDHLGPPQYEDFEPVMNQTSRPRCTSANGTRNSHAYSAADFASELAESRSTARSGEERGRAKAMRSHSAPRNMRRSGSAQTSTNKFSPRNSYAEPLSSSRRSISATRSVTGVSADLLADADK